MIDGIVFAFPSFKQTPNQLYTINLFNDMTKYNESSTVYNEFTTT